MKRFAGPARPIRLCLLLALLLWGLGGAGEIWAADPPRTVRFIETEGGVRFGLLGEKSDQPAPTLIILASSPEETLGSDYFLQAGVLLAKQGYLCVSLDLPCHGRDRISGEPEGIAGWRHRLDADQDLLADFKRRGQAMLSYLIDHGYTDATRVAVSGTSRGGFSALHLAAHDSRIRCVAAMAPVTELSALTEFQGMTHPERAATLSAVNLADKLAERGVWVVIGDRDARVGTDHAITFARRLTSIAVEKKLTASIELHVLSEPKGHTTPQGAAELSAAWIARQLQGN